MTYAELKNVIWEVVSSFFKGATVIWTEQINTVPKLPYVTLKTNGITRDFFASEDTEGNLYYNASTTLELNLYTAGMATSAGDGKVKNYINTATSDMADFYKFIDSDEGLLLQEAKGITILLSPPIRDMTEVQNDRNYRYRAYSEATISFVDMANGAYGLMGGILPNVSGGGSSKMATTDVEAIEEIIIEGGNKV